MLLLLFWLIFWLASFSSSQSFLVRVPAHLPVYKFAQVNTSNMRRHRQSDPHRVGDSEERTTRDRQTGIQICIHTRTHYFVWHLGGGGGAR